MGMRVSRNMPIVIGVGRMLGSKVVERRGVNGAQCRISMGRNVEYRFRLWLTPMVQ